MMATMPATGSTALQLDVRPSGAVMGAEIVGLDLAAGVDEKLLIAIRDAVLRHSVIVLRDQSLTTQQQQDFTGRIGDLHPPVELYDFAPRGFPQMLVVSNVMEDGRKIGISDAGVLWHTDNAFQKNPDTFATLYAIEVPERDGRVLGDTLFASTTAAYEALDDAARARLAGLTVAHSYGYHLKKMARVSPGTRPPINEAEFQKLGEAFHPLVLTHPITGRKILYVTESFSDRVEGLAPDESRRLIDELCAYLIQERFLYRHRWRRGDFVIWDNLSTQHRATFDYGALPRKLHRCGTMGPIPA
jgi:taurine dioxygenase